MTTLSLLDYTPPAKPLRARFEGHEVASLAEREAKLHGDLLRVHRFLLDGEWHTAREVADALNLTEPVASAQLRNLRKPKHGGFRVASERGPDKVFRYRLVTTGVTPDGDAKPARRSRLAERVAELEEALGQRDELLLRWVNLHPCSTRCGQCIACLTERAVR